MNYTKRIIPVLVFILLIFTGRTTSSSECLNKEIIVYNASGTIITAPGMDAILVIAVEIPEGNYIYANPKGKGIGKPTEISVVKNKFISLWEVRYPDGEKYQANSDPDPVNIYKKFVRFPLKLSVKNYLSEGDYSIKINLSILMCSSDACIPVEKSIFIPIKVKRNLSVIDLNKINEFSEFLALAKNNIKPSEKSKDLVSDSGSNGVDSIYDGIDYTPRYPEGKITGLFKAIVFGLIAGFILNFMPCVLPVVSLKIMSFVLNAGEKKNVIVLQGILFSAGIIASFMALAFLAAFSGYQWGALFQSRIFIIVMASFIFVMAVSLFGVFTINVPSFAGKAVSRSHGIYGDAFIKGAIATLLATPCSGPFLGGTLAWTLTMPPVIVFIIFTSVGIGMAFPYMLLAFKPSLIRIIPKPGAWMNHFETAMGFLLMFTVVYLFTILDDRSRMGLVLFLLILSVGLWQYGLFGSLDNGRQKRSISFAILLLLAITGYSLSFNYFFTGKSAAHEIISFSPERVLKNRDNGIITVVEFTAEWCPNCKLVEKFALESNVVQQEFARDDVEFMVADITRKIPQIESLMKKLGSHSIPLLVIFPPGKGFVSPLCLRDIYSAKDVIDAVKEAESFLNTK